MGDEHSLLSAARRGFLQHLAHCLGCDRLVKAARVRRHLAEELILCRIPLGELAALVAFRRHAADTEMGVPGLIARLIVLGILCPGIEEAVRSHGHGSASFTAAGLIHKIGRMPVAQEHGGPAVASVGSGHPAHAGLAVAVQVDDGRTRLLRGDLVEYVRVIHMGGIASAGNIQPVLRGIILAFDRLRNGTACRKIPLLRDHERCLGFLRECRSREAEQHHNCE